MILLILALHIAEACHSYSIGTRCTEYERTMVGELITKNSWLGDRTTDEDEEDEPIREL